MAQDKNHGIPDKTSTQGETVNGGFKVDLSGWKTKQLRAWQRFALTGDYDQQIVMAQAVMTVWPYPGDPQRDEDWDELPPRDMGKALLAVTLEANLFFRA